MAQRPRPSRIAAGLVCIMFGACAREPSEPQLLELAWAPGADDGAAVAPNEWRLTRPHADLRFFIGELDFGGGWTRLADSVPLADGGILAACTVAVTSDGFDYTTCFLELRLLEHEWRPVAIGLYRYTDIGFWWEEALAGRLVVDPATDELECRIDIRAARHGSVRYDFRIDPRSDSEAVRSQLEQWSGAPALGPGRGTPP